MKRGRHDRKESAKDKAQTHVHAMTAMSRHCRVNAHLTLAHLCMRQKSTAAKTTAVAIYLRMSTPLRRVRL